MTKRKDYPKKKGISKKGVRVSGEIYHEGKRIARINNETINEFEAKVNSIKLKFG